MSYVRPRHLMTVAGLAALAMAVVPLGPASSQPADDARVDIPAPSEIRPEVIEADGSIRALDLPISRKSTYTPAVENLREELATVKPLRSKVTTIQETGAASGRYNVVFVGDGYTSREQSKYLREVRDFWEKFQVDEPFKSYKKSFNVYAVNVISRQSGVDGYPAGAKRDTAMDMEVGCFDTARLMCVDTQKAKRYAANAPAVDLVIAMGNTDADAAGGYPGVSAVSARAWDAPYAALHEIGHSMGGLADEYFYDNKRYTGRELRAANVSIYSSSEMRRKGVKWANLLGTSTPDGGRIDTYEGAYISYSRGIYRPSRDSRMRNTMKAFNTPSVNALVAALKRRVPGARPDSEGPPGGGPTTGPTSGPTTGPTSGPTSGPTTEPTNGGDTFSDNTRRTIRDYQKVTSSVESTFRGASKVKLTVDINHRCSDHLLLVIVTPDGQRNTVKRSSSGCRYSWNGPLSDTYSMRSASHGTWTLEVSDHARGTSGTLNGWSIKFEK